MNKFLVFICVSLLFQLVVTTKRSPSRTAKRIALALKIFQDYKKEKEMRNLQTNSDKESGQDEETPLPPIDVPEPTTDSKTTSTIQIMDFGNFVAPKEEPKMTFNAFFFFFRREPPFKFIIPLKFRFARLRDLEEETDVQEIDSECIKGDKVQSSGDAETYKYNCEAVKPENTEIAQVAVNTEKKMSMAQNENETPKVIEETINYSQEAAESAATINEKTENIDQISYLQDGTLAINEAVDSDRLYFRVFGNMTEIKDFKSIKINFTDTASVKEGEKKELECEVEEQGLKCNTDGKNFTSKVDGANGLNEGTKIILNMTDSDATVIKIYLDENTTNTNPNNHINYRKNSSGLSGGAIAGIVIACAVVLIAASIVAMMLRKPTPPLDNTTVVGLKTVDNY